MSEKIILNDMNFHIEVRRAIRRLGMEADLNHLDVSKVTNMHHVFEGTPYIWHISRLDVFKVENMDGMFLNSQFNGDISQWDITNECKVPSNNALLHHTKIGKIHFMERANDYWRRCTWPERYKEAFDRFIQPILGLYPYATPSEKGALAWIAYQDSLRLEFPRYSIELPNLLVD